MDAEKLWEEVWLLQRENKKLKLENNNLKKDVTSAKTKNAQLLLRINNN